jgi:hypothetical protein
MMDIMETETTQTSEQLASLDKRLTVVERDLAVLAKTVATKDDLAALAIDLARIDATLALLQENCATKADLREQETRIMKWMIATLIGVTTFTSTLVVVLVRVLQI